MAVVRNQSILMRRSFNYLLNPMLTYSSLILNLRNWYIFAGNEIDYLDESSLAGRFMYTLAVNDRSTTPKQTVPAAEPTRINKFKFRIFQYKISIE